MPRRPKETPEEYKTRMMDPISPSYCSAKWYKATINLGAGKTRSCHHPPEHNIPVNEVEVNFTAIHNTKHKKEQRKMMLEGKRPPECSYCWRIEDMNVEGTVADRIFYTCQFTEAEVQAPSKMPWDENVMPINLEISFDRICNFACSYCSANYSTTWAKDIKNNGPYNLRKDNHLFSYFAKDGSSHEPYGKYNHGNPFVKAFWDWWPELKKNLRVLRVTGGEPLMSPHFWKLTEKIEKEGGVNENFQLAVNSNLGSKFITIQAITEFSHKPPEFGLYTSCEAHGDQAGYIRDGLDYDYWLSNLKYFLQHGKSKHVTLMTTINALCLWSFTDFLDDMLKLKLAYGYTHPLISINMLRHPKFMSVLVLPEKLREERRLVLEQWYLKHSDDKGMTDFDCYSLKKLIAYLKEAETESRNPEADEHDFYEFYRQYDKRRGKNLGETFSGTSLIEWYNELKEKYGSGQS